MELPLLLPDVPHALQDLGQVPSMSQQLVAAEMLSLLEGEAVGLIKGGDLCFLTKHMRVSAITLWSNSIHLRHWSR